MAEILTTEELQQQAELCLTGNAYATSEAARVKLGQLCTEARNDRDSARQERDAATKRAEAAEARGTSLALLSDSQHQSIEKYHTRISDLECQNGELRKVLDDFEWFSQQKGSLEYEDGPAGETLARPWSCHLWSGLTEYAATAGGAISALRTSIAKALLDKC